MALIIRVRMLLVRGAEGFVTGAEVLWSGGPLGTTYGDYVAEGQRILTLERISSLTVFKTAAFDRSAIPPEGLSEG